MPFLLYVQLSDVWNFSVWYAVINLKSRWPFRASAVVPSLASPVHISSASSWAVIWARLLWWEAFNKICVWNLLLRLASKWHSVAIGCINRADLTCSRFPAVNWKARQAALKNKLWSTKIYLVISLFLPWSLLTPFAPCVIARSWFEDNVGLLVSQLDDFVSDQKIKCCSEYFHSCRHYSTTNPLPP